MDSVGEGEGGEIWENSYTTLKTEPICKLLKFQEEKRR